MSNKALQGMASIVVAGLFTMATASAEPDWKGQGGAMMGHDMAGHGGGMAMGQGMMDHPMMGDMGDHGAMMGGGFGAIWSLNLNDQQRKQLRDINRDLRKKHGDIRDQIEDASDQLWDLYAQDKRDVAAIGKVYDKIFGLRRQMIEQSLEAQNKAGEVLTKEQRDEWKRRQMQWRWNQGR